MPPPGSAKAPTSCCSGRPAADDLVDEPAVGRQIVKVGACAHQQRVLDGALEVAMGAFDGAVLVRDALGVAGRRHAVVAHGSS